MLICHSLDELIRKSFEQFKDYTGVYEKINGAYAGRSFGDFYTDVRSLSEKLLDMGLGGKNIIIYGRNSYNWMVAYLAIAAYVGAAVPIDKEWKGGDIKHVLSAVDVEYILYSDSLKENLEGIEVPKSNLEAQTSKLIKDGSLLDVKRKENSSDTERICTVMFTSGTTAMPKRIELSEKNMFASADEMAKLFKLSTDDRYMVALPLNHIATLLGIFIYPISLGASMYIPNDFKEMGEDLQLIRPTIFYGVPRIFEKIWEAIPEEKKAKIKKGIKLSNLLRKIGIEKRRQIFAELHKSLGGAVRCAVSGAIKLDDTLAHIFDDMGLPVIQAYGLTETAAVVACDSSLGNHRIGSVGKVLGNQECILIDKDEKGIGEICVKGDNVARNLIGEDGYFHTGDLGYFDKDGYLYITGRKKRMIKLSNAKNVYPDELEELLCRNHMINGAFVYEFNGQIAAKIASLADKDSVEAFVSEFNETLPKYKQIREFSLVDKLSGKLE